MCNCKKWRMQNGASRHNVVVSNRLKKSLKRAQFCFKHLKSSHRKMIRFFFLLGHIKRRDERDNKMKQEKKNHIDYTVICYFLRLRIVFILNVTFRTSIILSPHPHPTPPPPSNRSILFPLNQSMNAISLFLLSPLAVSFQAWQCDSLL